MVFVVVSVVAVVAVVVVVAVAAIVVGAVVVAVICFVVFGDDITAASDGIVACGNAGVVDVAASVILIWLLHLSLYVFAVAFAAFAFCLHV